MMNYIYQNTFEGQTNFGKFLHKHAVSTEACQSVRNRKEYLIEQIKEIKGSKILSLAAGPAMEIKEVLERSSEHHLSFIALDHDMETLIKFRLANHNARFRYALANAFTLMAGNYQTAIPRDFMLPFCHPRKDFNGYHKIFCQLKYELIELKPEDFDMVYSAGLYDYIKTYPLDDTRGTAALTKNLFGLVKPGGKLIVGNFNYNNPRDLRFVMEYIYDWKLIYREEAEMYEFLRAIPNSEIKDVQLIAEPAGINYFLRIVKQA
jgi:SAM-dependent methyltransferase